MSVTEDKVRTSDQADIKDLRDEFAYARDEKRHIREEGDTDMVYLLNPWDAKEQQEDKKLRAEAGRPMIQADELSQYVNQLINDVRQNKRGIKWAPAGAKATDKTAEVRQGIGRQIEYRSNAALDAYPVMFENAAQRSYGYLRIKPVYEHHKSRHQELRIVSVPNPNMVTEDPQGLAADGSDWKFNWFAESWAIADFKRTFRGATVQSFDAEHARDAKDWLIGSNRILVAERWSIVTRPRTLLYIDGPRGYQGPPLDEYADAVDRAALAQQGAQVVGEREVEYPFVRQQMFNGVEILDTQDFAATTLPFVPCYGKILFADLGNGPKKYILSLIRLARSPQMLYCYYRTQQAEMAGMIPKVPVIGYKGQFAGFENDWQRAPHEPLAFIEANHTVDGWPTAAGPMPLPQRLAYEAGSHLQALELCAEGARRAIQAAIGASPLPTAAQRHNEKSGKALQQIEDTAQRGSFHFIDHFDFSLTRTGIVLDDWIPHYYDAARQVTVRKPDDQPAIVSINDPDDPESVSATEGVHDVTISVGPRQSSAREAASDFADNLLQSPLMKLLPPEKALALFAAAIRLKDVGPTGDEMADIVSPKEQGQPSMQDMQALQAQVQQLQQQLQQAVEALKTEQAKQQATIAKAHIDNAGKIAVARISAAKEALNADAEAEEEALATGIQLAHEATQAELDRQHEAALAAQGHAQAMAQADAAHANAIDQQATQAALQPPPQEEGE